METTRNTEITRLPGEAREVFLSRVLLLLVDELQDTGVAGDLSPLREALEDDRLKGVRKGRARPNGRV